MSDIKFVITSLCKHLNLLFNIDLKPEYFRLAKFDKTEENLVSIFWNLLSKFVKKSYCLNTVINVKLNLAKLEYKGLQFFGLDKDKQYGSRELLIALGYLIAKGCLNEIVEREIHSSPFHITHEYKCPSKYKAYYLSDLQWDNEIDLSNIKQWLKGKLLLNDRIINNYDIIIENTMKKIKLGLPLITGQYSVPEIFALLNSNYGKQFLFETERILNIMNNHEIWLKKEHLFWNWMDTVLSERNHHSSEINQADLDSFLSLLQNY